MWSGTSTSTVDCAALIPPQTITGNFLQIVTDKGTVTYSLDAKVFASGQSYHLMITVNAAAIDATISVTDWDSTGKITVTPAEGGRQLTIDPIANVTYTGSAQTPAIVVKYNNTTLTKDAANGYTCLWSNNIDAGTAVVVAIGQGTYAGAIAGATFTIQKANPTYTAPTSRTPKYSGEAEQLINAGSSSDGTIYYKLGSGQWTDDATTITATALGDYTVYWKIVGDANHNDVAESSLSVTVTSLSPDDVGKVICSSGHVHDTVSDAEAHGCTASGIIAYVNEGGVASNTCPEVSGTYAGLALALTDVSGNYKWDTTGNNCLTQSTDWAITKLWFDGVASTNALTSTEGTCASHTHAAAVVAKAYPTARPSGASMWFLPSIGQWNLMVKKMAVKAGYAERDMDWPSNSYSGHYRAPLNTVITAAGGTALAGTFYWSSSDYGSNYAWYANFSNGHIHNWQKTATNFSVRAAFAFLPVGAYSLTRERR